MDVLDLVKGKETRNIELFVDALFHQGDRRNDLSLGAYLRLKCTDRSNFSYQTVRVHFD